MSPDNKTCLRVLMVAAASIAFGVAFGMHQAQAANFGHPAAHEVTIMGSGPAELCYYTYGEDDWGANPTSLWQCDEIELYGARNPETYTLPENGGPVVVRGATWVFVSPRGVGGAMVPLVPAP